MDNEKLMVKLAQLRSLASKKIRIENKKECIKFILQELDLNVKVPSTAHLKKCNKILIGSTLLELAYKSENIEAFDILICLGADFTIKNKNGNTILHEVFCSFGSSLTKWDKKENNSCKNAKIIAAILSAHVRYKNMSNPLNSNGLSHFHIACATNHYEAVDFFLKNGVSVDQVVIKRISGKYFKKYTPLHFAARFGYLKVSELLLQYGANATLKDAKKQTPLLLSLQRNISMIDIVEEAFLFEDITMNEKVMNLLLRHDSSVKLLNLHIASGMQNKSNIENSLAKNKDVNRCLSIRWQKFLGYTALHIAAQVDIDTVKLLVRHGANIDTKDANGVTPFDMCIERYKAEDIFDVICLVPKWRDILLSDGITKLTDLLFAFKDLDEMNNFLQKSDENIRLFVPFDSPLWPGFTLLHVAVLLSERKKFKLDYKENKITRTKTVVDFEPDFTIIEECLKQGVDVTVKDACNWSPIHLAYRLGKNKTLKLLFQYHYRMINTVDNDNLSHLHIACAVKNQDFVKRILMNNVDVNIAYRGKSSVRHVSPGMTPLHIAVYKEDDEISRILVKFGADPHKTDDYSFTPTHYLIRDYFSKTLTEKMLSTINLPNMVVKNAGLSYLHVACTVPSVEAVKKLIEIGADVNGTLTDKNIDSNVLTRWKFEDKVGETPLHFALTSLYLSTEIVSLLIENGANILLKDSSGLSPLGKILEWTDYEFQEVLITVLKRDDDLRKRVETETGVTLLHIACCIVNIDVMKECLSSGADVNAKIHKHSKIFTNCTPLHLLLFDYQIEIDIVEKAIKLMIDNNADVTLLDSSQRTPLHVAYDTLCLAEELDEIDSSLIKVSLLLKAHKNFYANPKSIKGISHFHIACHMLDVEVVKNFLKHDVEVNSKIDLFCDSDIAGCTPLLLVTRETNWRITDESTQLKIVDLLIKYGAQVNVEDILGNTPAHYAVLCSSPKRNYLQLLAKAGADMNATNLLGKTPLEVIKRNKKYTLKNIKYSINCGCSINTFNPVTEEGYIAVASIIINYEDLKCLLLETFENSSNTNINSMNRTAIHNLVSTECADVEGDEYAELIDIITQFGCDVDDQDNLGRTALHLAAQFRNSMAVAGLLLVGANINIVDYRNRSPIEYAFDSCEEEDEYSNLTMFTIFVNHIRKLEICNLEVSDLNVILVQKIYDRFDPDDLEYDPEDFLLNFKQMINLEIKPYKISLVDFIDQSNAVYDYHRMSEAKRDAVNSFFQNNRNYFREKFKHAAGIFQLQYRQALLRRKIINEANDALCILARFKVPEVCSDIILRFLKNSELKNLILSIA